VCFIQVLLQLNDTALQFGDLIFQLLIFCDKCHLIFWTHDLNVGDDIMIIGPTTGVYEDTVKEIRVDLLPVNQTVKGELCSIPAHDIVRRGDKVYKIIEATEDDATL
ncbi:MAG: hypothetical protein II662_06950, partial [Bacteroidales bacterium]|nr:hypothetical protein [Bacteroidales bacterium]